MQLSDILSLRDKRQIDQHLDSDNRVLESLQKRQLSPLDLLPHNDLREKLIELVLYGEPSGLDAEITAQFQRLRMSIEEKDVEGVRIVVFGGGTGLSNLIGGDSRCPIWTHNPFVGLKEVFPQTSAIVCVTDDGGSSGELQKDLPLIALGDLRHVLLSSIRSSTLRELYDLTLIQASNVVVALSALFNHRFQQKPDSVATLVAQTGVDLMSLPPSMGKMLMEFIELLFSDPRLETTLARSQCLGNLILAAAIYAHIPQEITHDNLVADHNLMANALSRGLSALTAILGAAEQAVLPCTSTQARLSVRYSNGVQVVGEYKSGYAQRGCPVDRVFVEFCGKPHVRHEVLEVIAQADILILAPGSLYSSLIPIFQVPGLAEAVRKNTLALKLLVSNLWIQGGETDRRMGHEDRKFHVSDLLRAYERNISGGTKGLFEQILCLSLKDVPASILQNYALEGKVPIYLDRDKVCAQGFTPIECGIFNKTALTEQGVIQHGPIHLAKVIKTLWSIFDQHKGIRQRSFFNDVLPPVDNNSKRIYRKRIKRSEYTSWRYQQIEDRLLDLSIEKKGCLAFANVLGQSSIQDCDLRIKEMIKNILWRHPDILLAHLDNVRGIVCVERDRWPRSQQWDNVFSFYDPKDSLIKIRQDQMEHEETFEVAFLVAIGQSLLGNYASRKVMKPVAADGIVLGKVYHLYLRPVKERNCYFDDQELQRYLKLARMRLVAGDHCHFTRLLNGAEGFTTPGVLMGFNYAWYLDNRFARNIEYKMTVMKIAPSSLISAQVKMVERRQGLVNFFREVVFRK